ncbi:MAG: DUF177 domain-containing protein [Acidobacteria bacterium]|nr:DUF177 domain-containing protein [Acidobacteriota bacterium]
MVGEGLQNRSPRLGPQVQPETKGNDMFLDVNELAVRKSRIRKSYPAGMLDFHSADFLQAGPLDVRATAEVVEGHIRVFGQMSVRVELVCARCLEAVTEEVSRDFDLYYRPASGTPSDSEVHLKDGETEVGFFEGEGIFLSDILTEQVNLQIPMKAICRSDCRGLCPQCGANLNHEECRCETHTVDPRLQPLARLKQDWSKKQ